MITGGLVLILSMLSSVPCDAECGYQSCTGTKEGALNVHLVPHTHDDVGWLKTVDEYYYGSNNSIQHAGVQYILDSVVSELQSDPDKRFIYVEVAFFERWWSEQTVSTTNIVKQLVNEGRLMFMNGGWCMNDEASTHYNAIIDQMTLGLKFLDDNFGTCGRPLIAWHIDPFGHSREQSSLFAQMSFDAFFFARIDYADQSKREKTKTMEAMWKSSTNLGSSADLFFGTLYGPLYGPPHGFCFDQGCHDQPIQDDKNLFDYNVDQKVKDFITAVQDQAKHYKTNHIMMTMGSDFQYENANAWFKNLDKLIKYVNAKANSTKINLLYSNPACYVKSLNDAGVMWDTKSDDFFPYGDAPHNYWSGYFTSRPSIKGYVRESNNILQICKQLEILGKSQASSDTLKRAMAVAQHHDAVSGTEKQHVANDYAKRLAIGRTSCQELIGTSITSLMMGKTMVNEARHCEYMNISICDATENEKQFIVTIYNPIARVVNNYAKIAVDGSAYEVTDDNKTIVKSQLFDVTSETKRIRGKRKGSSKVLVFSYTVPALGWSTYHVSAQNHLTANRWTKGISKYTTAQMPHGGDTIISNKILSLTFDGNSGLLKSITNIAQNTSIKVNQSFYWYNASTGNDVSSQVSGAYIFRPNKTTPIPLFNGKSVSLTVIKGEIVQEVHQQFQPWLSQVVRLRESQDFAEFEWTVGPIPINDGFGKEIISRFESEIESANIYYTDANGRQMIKRKLNYRETWTYNNTEPVAGNYYPVNSRIYIKDCKSQLTVLTDRSQGGSSLTNGSLELMIHRRLLLDDYRGVGEPLNETGQFGDGLMVRGKHYVQLAKPLKAGKMHRDLGERLYMAPMVMFMPGGIDRLRDVKLTSSMLQRPLPENVHLLSLEKWNGTTVLLRLEHQYEKTDDADLSKNVTVSLKGLFVAFDIQSVQEKTLSSNQPLLEAKRLQWKTADGLVPTDSKPPPVSPDTLNVTLTPMQIRTFLAKIKMH